MESWNVYPQNAPNTPNSAWLCPQNNTPGSEWLHSQNNSNERERNENTAALATPTRYIMEYNDVNQNSSSGSFYNPYEMERLFENNFLKIGNPEDLLNNDIYNNENLSWLNSNENIIPVTTTTTSNIITTTAPSTIPSNVNITNSPTPSLVTDDDQDQLYNNNNLQQDERRIQNPVSTTSTTTASFIQYPVNTSPTKSSSNSSPISPRVVKENHYPISTTSATFYQPNLQQDHYLQSKKHDPKQLLLPLTTNTNSIDGTIPVSISSPTSSLFTDDDLDQCDQTKIKSRRQNYYQDFPLSVSTNDLPMQQPSPASSEFSSGEKTPPPCNETTSKQKKRRVSQRKLNNRRNSKVEGSLISPADEPYSESNGQASTSISDDISDIEDDSPTSSKDISIDSSTSDSSNKRDAPDDGHDETPEEKRARLLERNRIAAAKCRQKKKQAQESLQQQASDLTQKNTTMHSLVNDLREEALKLKNQLLAHSTCNCNVIQEYVRTSGQFAFARPPYTK